MSGDLIARATAAAQDFFDAPLDIQRDVLAMRPDLARRMRDWYDAQPDPERSERALLLARARDAHVRWHGTEEPHEVMDFCLERSCIAFNWLFFNADGSAVELDPTR